MPLPTLPQFNGPADARAAPQLGARGHRDAGGARPWCALALPHAAARAVDRRGHVIALRGTQLRDETAGTPTVTLPSAEPCAARRDHLAFERDGTAVAIARGRVYLRPAGREAWVLTPVCTSVQGEPWAARTNARGWALIARRAPEREPALLLTDDPAAVTAWAAYRALDPSLTFALLQGDTSMLALTAGGHLVFVDNERYVAGEVIAASQALYASLTRTVAGIAVTRDVDATTREVVVGSSIQGTFTRTLRARPAGARTARVFAADLGRLLAVTDRGVEWADDGDAPFVEVARWPAPLTEGQPGADGGDAASLGWLDDGSIAIVSSLSIVSPQCAELAQTAR